MQGNNAWNSSENGDQPETISYAGGSYYYTYTQGCIRWAKVKRGSNLYTGWVLCYPSGKPITYADGSVPGSIKVSASGSYITL